MLRKAGIENITHSGSRGGRHVMKLGDSENYEGRQSWPQLESQTDTAPSAGQNRIPLFSFIL